MDATVIVGNEAYTLQADKIVLKSTTDAFNFNVKINNENILLAGAVQDDQVIETTNNFVHKVLKCVLLSVRSNSIHLFGQWESIQ